MSSATPEQWVDTFPSTHGGWEDDDHALVVNMVRAAMAKAWEEGRQTALNPASTFSPFNPYAPSGPPDYEDIPIEEECPECGGSKWCTDYDDPGGSPEVGYRRKVCEVCNGTGRHTTPSGPPADRGGAKGPQDDG